MNIIAQIGSTTLDRKRIYANPSSYLNPKVQLCFWTDEMTSFFNQVYRYRPTQMKPFEYRKISAI